MHPPATWTKAIPPVRDRLQSRILVWAVVPLLCLAAVLAVTTACLDHLGLRILASSAISLAFALMVWRLKAATPAAAAFGGIACLLLSFLLVPSALAPLLALFLLTHIATRAGRRQKVLVGLAEPRAGRRASQVIANLCVAALLAFPFGLIIVDVFWPGGNNGDYRNPIWVVGVLVLSALTEATADTVSSEVGQAFGGTPFLLTTWRRVAPGTDGAISLRGTFAGILAAAIVAAAGACSLRLSLQQSSIALVAGVCGLFFDSLLGATLERRGWIGNDVVNFFSTAFAAAIGFIAVLLVPGLSPHHFVVY